MLSAYEIYLERLKIARIKINKDIRKKKTLQKELREICKLAPRLKKMKIIHRIIIAFLRV